MSKYCRPIRTHPNCMLLPACADWRPTMRPPKAKARARPSARPSDFSRCEAARNSKKWCHAATTVTEVIVPSRTIRCSSAGVERNTCMVASPSSRSAPGEGSNPSARNRWPTLRANSGTSCSSASFVSRAAWRPASSRSSRRAASSGASPGSTRPAGKESAMARKGCRNWRTRTTEPSLRTATTMANASFTTTSRQLKRPVSR
mmetsp:Transcript_29982/g.82645  ORF Transcript_29982/g.82645 Transcript_29982/m.82645 type:complete len:203 (-) Transcript_29982:133-741(-)